MPGLVRAITGSSIETLSSASKCYVRNIRGSGFHAVLVKTRPRVAKARGNNVCTSRSCRTCNRSRVLVRRRDTERRGDIRGAAHGRFRQGDLRYWSFCSNQGFANTRVNDCVFDENVPVAPNGYYTIVVSRPADRPRNATAQCGVAWLPMAEDGDGAVDSDVTVLQLRHMLGTQDFPHSIQAIQKRTEVAQTMGEYYPRGRDVSTSAFEIGVPCLIEKR